VFPATIAKPKPSPDCPTGTRGRIAVMEAVEIDKDIEQLILKTPNEPEIYKVARAKGMLTMREDAIMKVFKKEVALEEIYNL
jgi:type IV pilus assembly protein PilB